MTLDVAKISTPLVILLGNFIDVSTIGRNLPADLGEAEVVKKVVEFI